MPSASNSQSSTSVSSQEGGSFSSHPARSSGPRRANTISGSRDTTAFAQVRGSLRRTLTHLCARKYQESVRPSLEIPEEVTTTSSSTSSTLVPSDTDRPSPTMKEGRVEEIPLDETGMYDVKERKRRHRHSLGSLTIRGRRRRRQAAMYDEDPFNLLLNSIEVDFGHSTTLDPLCLPRHDRHYLRELDSSSMDEEEEEEEREKGKVNSSRLFISRSQSARSAPSRPSSTVVTSPTPTATISGSHRHAIPDHVAHALPGPAFRAPLALRPRSMILPSTTLSPIVTSSSANTELTRKLSKLRRSGSTKEYRRSMPCPTTPLSLEPHLRALSLIDSASLSSSDSPPSSSSLSSDSPSTPEDYSPSASLPSFGEWAAKAKREQWQHRRQYQYTSPTLRPSSPTSPCSPRENPWMHLDHLDTLAWTRGYLGDAVEEMDEETDEESHEDEREETIKVLPPKTISTKKLHAPFLQLIGADEAGEDVLPRRHRRRRLTAEEGGEDRKYVIRRGDHSHSTRPAQAQVSPLPKWKPTSFVLSEL